MSARLLIVGAGFSGAVLARELAQAGERVLVIDARPHLGGNSHTERDPTTGVMEHRYGPHIFHSPRRDVWDYLDRFGDLQPYVHRVKASIPRGVFGLPINLHTINQFFGQRLDPTGAREFLAKLADRTIGEPANFEEQALKMIGRELYEAFFYGYTKKQWGCEPRELPAAILKRLPVRFDYNDSYYNDQLQGIPKKGYTEAIRGMLEHEGIEVRLSTPWEPAMAREFGHVFFTGSIDAFYGYELGRLRYRTVYWERFDALGDYQGTAQMNFPGLDAPQTRVCEHKHFAPWEQHERTYALVEYSKATEAGDDPYYPLRLPTDVALFQQYARRATAQRGVSFLGRLATYRYLDMHHVIGEALDFAPRWLKARAAGEVLPVFPAGLL
jgi:UDP-galactopyranose mutase